MAGAPFLFARPQSVRTITGRIFGAACLLQTGTYLPFRTRHYATEPSSSSSSTSGSQSTKDAPKPHSSPSSSTPSSISSSSSSSSNSSKTSSKDVQPTQVTDNTSLPPGWEDESASRNLKFSELPHQNFGFNQHMVVNAEFKEALRQILWQFRAPIRYAFAYGSGVFSQGSGGSSIEPSPHPNPPEAVTKWQKGGGKNIDFIFGVSHTQHWHSLNLQQHSDHYSFLGSFGSGVVSRVQDDIGAGVYYNAYVVVNGIMIKYGVINLDTLYRDLSEWDTLYLAGRLQKPVKILRDDPRIRLANQKNLISALRTALLMLPSTFTEHELYTKIANISYLGDPRMTYGAENPRKIANIVDNQIVNFRQLYLPLIDDLPNVNFNDPNITRQGWTDKEELNCKLEQDMTPTRRGNMVRRLPKSFRQKLYRAYSDTFNLTSAEYRKYTEEGANETSSTSHMGTDFDKRIAASDDISKAVRDAVKKTVNWPSTTQSMKGILTAGVGNGWRYLREKRAKGAKEQTKIADTDKQAQLEDAKKNQ